MRKRILRKSKPYHGTIYSIGKKIPSVDVRDSGGAAGADSDAEKRHRHGTSGARLPVLRVAWRRKNVVRAYFCQNHQLHKPHSGRRGVQRMRLMPPVQREPLAEHHRARRRLEQRRRRYQGAHGAGARAADARTLPRVHHR